jgi:hypothetical protein
MVAAKNARCLYSIAKSTLTATAQGKDYIIVRRRDQCQVSLLSNAVKTPGTFRSCDSRAAD